MIIKKVEVKNFRSIHDQCLECDNLTVLLGRNGAGKSSFLYAISTFYNISAPITEEDFFDRDSGSPIEIRITYGELRDDERDEFRSFIRDEEFIVKKRISSEDGRIVQRYYAADLQHPRFAQIRALVKKTERVSAWKEMVAAGELPGVDTKGVRSADDVEALMRQYETDHADEMTPVDREVQFLGPANIGGGKLDKFTRFVLVPAVREASEEVAGRKGAVYQLLDMIVTRKIDAREDIRQFKVSFDENVRKLYSSENLTELPELGRSISETLEKFSAGSKLNLRWGEVKLPEVPLPPVKATLVEDDFEGEIDRKGHGLQRALILTLLQHLAMTVPIETAIHDGETTEKGLAGGIEDAPLSRAGPDLILAIEEPELYLHPSRCRFLAEVLLRLTRDIGMGLAARNQVVYTTHSPYFVDLWRFNQIRMVRKRVSSDSPVQQTIVTRFSLEDAVTVAQRYDLDALSYTEDGFRARAVPVMNSIVNEGFFADVVVVVEGQSDVGILWRLQELLHKNWSGLGIVPVPAGGKNNIDRPTILFRGFGIPTYFVFDGDSSKSGSTDEVRAKKCNQRYLRLAGASTMRDFPETQVHENWAVFNDNLESIIREELGNDTFQTILQEVGTELGYTKPSDVMKNSEGAAQVIDAIYQKGHRVPVLEEIVEKATSMRR